VPDSAGLREAIARTLFEAQRADNGSGSVARARMLADALVSGPLAALLTERDEAVGRVERIAALHKPYQADPFGVLCEHDEFTWPCETAQLGFTP
jgi:hypothetical protein